MPAMIDVSQFTWWGVGGLVVYFVARAVIRFYFSEKRRNLAKLMDEEK